MTARKKQLSVPSLAELSRRSGISREILRKWRADGVNIYDTVALAKRISEKQPSPHAIGSPPAHASGESYSEARRRREIAAANRMETIAQKEAGELILISEVEQLLTTIAAIFKSGLRMLNGSLPGELEGLDAPAMQARLRARFDELLEAISDDRIKPDSIRLKPKSKHLV